MITMPITAIILAGGKSSRMGGDDKGLLLLHNKPLYAHVIERICHQVDKILINCNRNAKTYRLSGYSTFSDDLSGHLGPLSGIYSGLLRSQTDWNLIVSCDTPFLPDDLVKRLYKHIENHDAAYVFDGLHAHPTILLIHLSVAEKIKNFLAQGNRKFMLFLNEINTASVDFSDKQLAFTNINTPDDLNQLQRGKA